MGYPLAGLRGYLTGSTSGSSGGAMTGDSLAVTGNVSGATGTFSGDITAASVTCPLFRTTTATDVVFQRNSATKLTLIATGVTVTGDAGCTTVTCPLIGTTTAADVVFQRNSTEVLRITSTGVAVPVGKVLEVYNVGTPSATDYERAAFSWSSNILTLGMQKGGTGANRVVQMLHGDLSGIRMSGGATTVLVGSAGGAATLLTESDTIGMHIYGKITTSTSVASVDISNAPASNNFSAASGTQKQLSVFATTNQSGSAGFITLETNTTPTATGSGTVMGLSIKRSTVEVFAIDVKATLTADADTVMFLTYFSSSAVKHARVTLGVDVAGKRNLQVAT